MIVAKNHIKLTTAQLGTIASLAVGDGKFNLVWATNWKPWLWQWEVVSTNHPSKVYAVIIDKRMNVNASVHLKKGIFAKEDVQNQWIIWKYLAKEGFIKI